MKHAADCIRTSALWLALLASCSIARAQFIGSPALVQPSAEQLQASMERAMPGLNRALGLTVEQTREFLAHMAGQSLRISTMVRQLSPGVDLQSAIAADRRTTEAEAEQRFGSGIMEKYRRYMQLIPGYGLVTNLEPELYKAKAPLSDEQRDQLALAYIESLRKSGGQPNTADLIRNLGKGFSSKQIRIIRKQVELRMADARQRQAFTALTMPAGIGTAAPFPSVPGGIVTMGRFPMGEASQPATPERRQQLLAQYANLTRDMASFMRLNEAQLERLNAALVDFELNYRGNAGGASFSILQSSLAGNMFGADPLLSVVTRELGETSAARWTQFRALRMGLTQTNEQLRHFYDAEVPLSDSQRLQLAEAYTGVNEAAIRNYREAPPQMPDSPLGATANLERSLALSERRAALTLNQARNYLNATQLEVLFRQLDKPSASTRQQLRLMRESAAASQSGADREPSTEQAGPAMALRINFVNRCQNGMLNSAEYLKLDAAGMKRLCEVIAGPHIERYESDRTQWQLLNNIVPGIAQGAVANAFGADFAARWTQYENLRSGLGFVDSQLRYFYDAGAPLTVTQRQRLASSYQQAKLAEYRVPANPEDRTASSTLNASAERLDSEMRRIDKSHAAILGEAKTYLERDQLTVFSARLEDTVRMQRESARLMRENAASAAR